MDSSLSSTPGKSTTSRPSMLSSRLYIKGTVVRFTSVVPVGICGGRAMGMLKDKSTVNTQDLARIPVQDQSISQIDRCIIISGAAQSHQCSTSTNYKI